MLECRARPETYRIDLRDHAVFPGLVNAHDHLQLNAIPRLPVHEPFPNSYAFHFPNPGSFAYQCRIHDHMIGSISART